MAITVNFTDLHMDGVGYVSGRAEVRQNDSVVDWWKFRINLCDPLLSSIKCNVPACSTDYKQACQDLVEAAAQKGWIEEKIRTEARAVYEMRRWIKKLLGGCCGQEIAAMPYFAMDTILNLYDRLNEYVPMSNQQIDAALEKAKIMFDYEDKYEAALSKFCEIAEQEGCFLPHGKTMTTIIQ